MTEHQEQILRKYGAKKVVAHLLRTNAQEVLEAFRDYKWQGKFEIDQVNKIIHESLPVPNNRTRLSKK